VLDDPTVYDDLPIDEFDSSTVGERVSYFAHSVLLAIRDGLKKTPVSRTAVAKCCKLAKLTHQSANFRLAFGRGRAVPSSNDTRWNSVFHQIKYVVDLDGSILSSMLKKENQGSLIVNQKELQQLCELVEILSPSAEAINIAQGSPYITISCIIPILLSLVQGLTH